MSRRKQSNPKPLKREDEEWGTESEAMQEDAHTPNSPQPRAASTAPPSPAVAPASPAPTTSPPRIRLNASLATDPALAPTAAAIKSEPEESPAPTPPLPSRDFIAALPPALTSALAAGLFPPPARAERPAPPTVPAYMCAPCGIKYSSLSTLEAHKTYYCSHRPGKPADGDDKSTDGTDETSSEHPSKTPRVAKQYACTQCSYSADKKVSLNRHMRMHSASPNPSPAPPSVHSNGDASLDASSPAAAVVQDRYCTDCDIRFSSTKTFHAHKKHYCSTRQVVKPAPGSTRSGSSSTSGSAPPSPNEQRITPPAASGMSPHQPFLALPTNPILIVPYSLLRGASVLPGSTVAGLPDRDAPCFLLPNGTIHPMPRAFTTPDAKEPEVLKSANRPRDGQTQRDASAPLDLSVRRTPESGSVAESDEHEKENRLRHSTTPEQIVCAPSLPASPATPSPSPRRSASPAAGETSPKRRRRESRDPTPKPPSEEPPDDKFPLHPLLMRGGLAVIPPEFAQRLAELPPPPGPPAQVLVKQGSSKCKHCNIVFCQYENYLVHKRKYCSSRGRDDEIASPAPPDATTHYQQLICVACGIKFNSIDNLLAHQSYYCTKRETRSPRAGACEAERQRGGSEPAAGGWKCPCCEVVSATAHAAQRHMESHVGVKAFRCTICRYKGNTLRGMRTHIRMHFPNKPQDLQEESYISCVVEEGAPRETASPAAAAAVGAPEKLHRCSCCDYTSTYRGNVVRHARLVHPNKDPEPIEAEPEPVVKKEPEEEQLTTVGPGPNYCKSCDISFKYVNTFIAHKKHYCTSHSAEGASAQTNNNVPGRVSEAPAPVQ